MHRILVSACLLGQLVRYDGRGKPLHNPHLQAWQAEGRLVPVCPELLGGFPVPRPQAEIEPGYDGGAVLDGRARVWEASGRDVTSPFLHGAHAALAIARETGCAFALLTDGSPSCGSTVVHGGRFDGRKVPGMGVVAALLRRHGIAVFPEAAIGALAARIADDCGGAAGPPAAGQGASSGPTGATSFSSASSSSVRPSPSRR